MFLEHATAVMQQREADGLRGVDREWSRFRLHLATAPFASRPINEIAPRDIREWLRIMHDKEAVKPGAPRLLSRHTVKRCQSLLSSVFADAVEREIIDVNPALRVKIRKRVDESDTEDKWAYLTPAEQKAIRSCVAVPVEDRLMIAFSHDTGLRQGEWRHLERTDLAVEGPDPHVMVRFAGRRKDGKKLPPKNGKVRRVPLLPPALAAARTWLLMLDRYAPSNPENLVFPTAKGGIRQQGKPLGRGDTLKNHYRAAGVALRPHLHWHALRHTFATNLIAGVYGRPWRLEEVQIVMGHSSYAVTQRYAHLGEDAIRKAARETAAAWARSS